MKRIYILFAFALMILALLCVTSAAFAASDVKLADTIDYSDGHTTISWTGDDGGTRQSTAVLRSRPCSTAEKPPATLSLWTI